MLPTRSSLEDSIINLLHTYTITPDAINPSYEAVEDTQANSEVERAKNRLERELEDIAIKHEAEERARVISRLAPKYPSAVKEIELLYQHSEGVEERDMVMHDVLQLLETFDSQGHSGYSAPYILDKFVRLAKHEALTPLTGEDWEWMDIQEAGEEGYFQNIRNGSVFKRGGKCYYSNGKIFIDKQGLSFTSRESYVEILSFPFTPTPEIIYVDR